LIHKQKKTKKKQKATDSVKTEPYLRAVKSHRPRQKRTLRSSLRATKRPKALIITPQKEQITIICQGKVP